MRGEDLVGNMRLMGLGDPPYPEDQFVAKVSTPPVPFIVRRAPVASTAQYGTSQQQIARQQLERARLDLQQRAQQQAQQQAAQQRYQQQAEQQRKAQQFVQIVAANMAAKTIFDAAKSVAASHRAEAIPGAVSAVAVQSAASAQTAAQGASQNSTDISVSIQSRAPESQVESRGGYITAPTAGLPWAERDLVDISREADLSLAISRQAAIDKAHAAQQQAYEPTYIENPWVARVFGGQSAPSGVSTQLPNVAGEIVELPDLPLAPPATGISWNKPSGTRTVVDGKEASLRTALLPPIPQERSAAGIFLEDLYDAATGWLTGVAPRVPHEQALAPKSLDAEFERVKRKREAQDVAKAVAKEAQDVAKAAAKEAAVRSSEESAREWQSAQEAAQQRVKNEFATAFGRPTGNTFFDPFKVSRWEDEYEKKYLEKAPRTPNEMAYALQRRGELESGVAQRRQADAQAEALKKAMDRSALEVVAITPSVDPDAGLGPLFRHDWSKTASQLSRSAESFTEMAEKVATKFSPANVIAANIKQMVLNRPPDGPTGIKLSESDASVMASVGADIIRNGGTLKDVDIGVSGEGARIFVGKLIDKYLPNAVSSSDKKTLQDVAAQAAESAKQFNKSDDETGRFVKSELSNGLVSLIRGGKFSEKAAAGILDSLASSLKKDVSVVSGDARGLRNIAMAQSVQQDLNNDVSDAIESGYGRWTDLRTGKTSSRYRIGDSEADRLRYMNDRSKNLQDAYMQKASLKQKATDDIINRSPLAKSVVMNFVPLAESKLENLKDIGESEFVARFGDAPMSEEAIKAVLSGRPKSEAERIFAEYNARRGNVTTSSSVTRAAEHAVKNLMSYAKGFSPSSDKTKGRLGAVADVVISQVMPLATHVFKDLMGNVGTIARELGPITSTTHSDRERYQVMQQRLVPLLRAATQQVGDSAAGYIASMPAEKRDQILSDVAVAFIQGSISGPSVYADQPALEGGRPGSTMRGLRGFEWVS